MDFDKFTFRQIDADIKIKSFDCGDADLNDFLFLLTNHLFVIF